MGYVPPSEADLRYVFKEGDTLLGNLILNDDPTSELQAATKRYVDNISLTPGPPGYSGNSTLESGWNYNSTNFTGPPAVSQVRFNNANLTLATEMYISETDKNGVSRIIELDAAMQYPDLKIIVRDEIGATIQYAASTTNAIDNGTWRTIPVVSEGGSAALRSAVWITFIAPKHEYLTKEIGDSYYVNTDGDTMTDDLNLNGNKITNLVSQGLFSDTDAAPVWYVDQRAAGLDIHEEVKAATTTPVSLAGLLTVDGVALNEGDRVLVRFQHGGMSTPGAGTGNGIYIASTGNWTRAEDANTQGELKPGSAVFITGGNTYRNTLLTAHIQANQIPWVPGVSDSYWAIFSSRILITGGDGLVLTGNTLNVVPADNTLNVASDSIAVNTSIIQAKSEKSAASGYASLDNLSKVPIAEIPTGNTSTTVALGNHDHDATYVPATRAIISGNGLTGGGDLSTNRILDVGAGTGITVGADSVSVDRATVDTWYSAINHLHTGVYDPAGTSSTAIANHVADADPHTGYQLESEKAVAGGYASLDGSTKIPIAQVPTGLSGTTVALGNHNHDTSYSSITRQITAGAGLIGGGDLAADRTLAIGAGTGITVNADDIALNTTYTDGRYLQLSLADAKGDLLVGTADNTISRLAVGTNNYVLTADSTQSTGLKWAAITKITVATTAPVSPAVNDLWVDIN